MVPVMSVVLMGTDGAWEKKKIPMPRIEEKEEAREEKKGENGAWEKKKIPMPRIEEKEEAREEKKGENGAWEKKKDLPCPES